MTDFYSLTGEKIDLKAASDEQLAEVLDGLEAERSMIQERMSIVTREVAKRHPGDHAVPAGAWVISLRTSAKARRVVVD